MTSKLTRERLEKIRSWRETYGAGSNVMLPAEEAEELARIALAAMDSEPVVFTDERNLHHIAMGRETSLIWGKQNSEAGDIPLYRHAQQPVVPEEKPMPNPLSMYAVDAVAAIAEVKGWNACRAAMLQAGNSPVIPEGYVMVPKEPTKAMILSAMRDNETGEVAEIYDLMLAAAHQPQNAPQNIPEIIPGWIPVSEKLPEEGGRYWCYVEEQTDLGKSHYQWNCSWNGERWWVEGEDGGIVTHWMRLPAAPQEVKGE